MRIAVIADTHDRLPSHLLPKLSGVDEIWHLGDVCHPSILDRLQEIGAPLFVVQGNCDWTTEWPLTRLLERKGSRFYLVHIPPVRIPEGCDAVLHGHTHVPRDEVIDGVRFLNPGCITRPNRGVPASFAYLDIDEGAYRWTPMPLIAAPKAG